MIINKYKYNSQCEEIVKEWQNGLYSHLVFSIPVNGGVREEALAHRLADIMNEVTGSKRTSEESYLYLKYSNNFSENQRNLFFESPHVIAKNYNYFNGVFAIEVNDCSHDVHTSEFSELLEYVENNAEKMKFIFVVEENSEAIIQRLIDVVDVKEISLSYPEIEYFEVYLETELYHKGYSVRDKMRDEFLKLIEYYMKLDDFSGYDTIDYLINNIYYLYKKNNTEIFDISVLYQTKNKKNETKTKFIGF